MENKKITEYLPMLALGYYTALMKKDEELFKKSIDLMKSFVEACIQQGYDFYDVHEEIVINSKGTFNLQKDPFMLRIKYFFKEKTT